MTSAGQTVSMAELKIGDSVQVGPATFEDVYFFGHHDETAQRHSFLRVNTKTSSVRLTSNHILFISGEEKPARYATVGDTITHADGTSATIVSIEDWEGVGLYAPYTLSGRILVDSVLVSSHTEKHWVVRTAQAIAMLPLKHLQQACPGAPSAVAVDWTFCATVAPTIHSAYATVHAFAFPQYVVAKPIN